MLGLIIQLISGAAGGNIIGRLAKSTDMGPLLNTIIGAVGGAGGGAILGMLGLGGAMPDAAAAADAASSMDIGALLASVAGGGVGGGVLAGVIGMVKNMMSKG